MRRRVGLRALWVLALACTWLHGEIAAADSLVVHAARLETAAGPAIADGVVVIEDGRILAVGPSAQVLPPAGVQVLRAAVVTPGFVDVHSSIGLTGLLNVAAANDQDEPTRPNAASLRALDGFHPREPLVRFLLEHGVTLVQLTPGPSTPIAGQAGIFRTHGGSADQMAVRFPSALVFNLGDSARGAGKPAAAFPATRMGTAALVREALRAGEAHSKARRGLFGADDDVAPDADLEVLGRVARGELPALFRAERADDLLTAVRIAREFELRAALAGGSEAWLVVDELRASGLPLYVGPLTAVPNGLEVQNASWETPARLDAAGVPIAIRSGFEGYVPRTHLVLFEAALAAANGLPPERALHAITLGAAELLGVDGDYGSLEPGKVADLVLFDGDPFEYRSHVEAVIAGGAVVHRRSERAAR